jgi:hypothetical protein
VEPDSPTNDHVLEFITGTLFPQLPIFDHTRLVAVVYHSANPLLCDEARGFFATEPAVCGVLAVLDNQLF